MLQFPSAPVLEAESVTLVEIPLEDLSIIEAEQNLADQLFSHVQISPAAAPLEEIGQETASPLY